VEQEYLYRTILLVTKDGGEHLYSTFTSKCSSREEISNWSIILVSHTLVLRFGTSPGGSFRNGYNDDSYRDPENTYLLDRSNRSNPSDTTTPINQSLTTAISTNVSILIECFHLSTFPHIPEYLWGIWNAYSVTNSLSHRLNCWCLIYVYVYRLISFLFSLCLQQSFQTCCYPKHLLASFAYTLLLWPYAFHRNLMPNVEPCLGLYTSCCGMEILNRKKTKRRGMWLCWHILADQMTYGVSISIIDAIRKNSGYSMRFWSVSPKKVKQHLWETPSMPGISAWPILREVMHWNTGIVCN